MNALLCLSMSLSITAAFVLNETATLALDDAPPALALDDILPRADLHELVEVPRAELGASLGPSDWGYPGILRALDRANVLSRAVEQAAELGAMFSPPFQLAVCSLLRHRRAALQRRIAHARHYLALVTLPDAVLNRRQSQPHADSAESVQQWSSVLYLFNDTRSFGGTLFFSNSAPKGAYTAGHANCERYACIGELEGAQRLSRAASSPTTSSPSPPLPAPSKIQQIGIVSCVGTACCAHQRRQQAF